MKKSSVKPDYGKIALIVIIVVIVIAIIAGLVYYFTRDEEPAPAPAPAPAPYPFNAKPPAKKPYVFMPPLFRRRPEPKIIQPKVNVKVSTNKKKNNSNRATNLGLGYMLGASHEKNKEQQIQIEDLKCKQMHGSSSRYNPYTKSCETGVDNAVSGNGVPTDAANSLPTEPASNISGNIVPNTSNTPTKASNNLSNINTVVNNLGNVVGDVPVIGVQNNARQVVEEQTQNTYNNTGPSYVFDTAQGNYVVNNTQNDLIDIISYNNEHNINSYANTGYANNGYVNTGNNITVLPPGVTSFKGSTNGNLSYPGMDSSSVNGGIQNNLAVNGSGN
jgi:hypothetical protein